MSVVTTVLFDRPQSEIASIIIDRLAKSRSTSIVAGFLTPKGLSLVDETIAAHPKALDHFVVGAATYPALEGMDSLVAAGVPLDRLRVHLGHGAASGHRLKYRPMLHSKVYLMEMPDDHACAIVGSHNLTHFALAGLNGEAAIMIEGPSAAGQFDVIRKHVGAAWQQAVQYDPTSKQAYAWWSRQYFDGLQAEVEVPRDHEGTRTIVVLSATSQGARPRAGDEVYFEIPAGISQIDSLRTEAHLFLFNSLPRSAQEGLSRRRGATHRLLCTVLGIDTKRGNLEIRADWHIARGRAPELKPVTAHVLRPQPTAGMQQVRAVVTSEPLPEYDYLFERPSFEWVAELSPTDRIVSSVDLENRIDRSRARREQFEQRPLGPRARISPEETREWALVRALRSRATGERDQAALALAAPNSGAFILVAVSRRRLG